MFVLNISNVTVEPYLARHADDIVGEDRSVLMPSYLLLDNDADPAASLASKWHHVFTHANGTADKASQRDTGIRIRKGIAADIFHDGTSEMTIAAVRSLHPPVPME